MLHVGAVHVVPGHLGQALGPDLPGHLTERDHPQEVPRELAGHERVQGHRHLLGREEVPPHRHRQGEVQHENRGGPDLRLGAFDGEVLRREGHRHAGTAPGHRVANRLLDVQVERVTELPRPGRELTLVAQTGPGLVVAT